MLDMPQLSEDEKSRLFKTLDMHTEQNEKIERGLYGDAPNKVKGAIERIERIEKWIENHNVKTAYISGMVATAILFLKIGWDWLIEHVRNAK